MQRERDSEFRSFGDTLAGMGQPRPRGADDPDAGGIWTDVGWVDDATLREHHMRAFTDANGNRVIQFPERYVRLGSGDFEPVYRDEIPPMKLARGVAKHERLLDATRSHFDAD